MSTALANSLSMALLLCNSRVDQMDMFNLQSQIPMVTTIFKGRNSVPVLRLNSFGLRHYHATGKKEIVPIIVGVGIIAVCHYSWRAMKRMDEEWQDYQWKLQQYERKHGVINNDRIQYPDGTVAIDLGTFYLKLAKDRQVLTNREGGRFTFGGLVQSDETTLVGHRAFEKYYEVPDGLRYMAGQENTYIPKIVQSALDDILDRENTNIHKIRPVATFPPSKWEGYRNAFSNIFSNPAIIPEPVAAIWGAQIQNEIPHDLNTPVLVIDIGGFETTFSVVKKNVILSTATLHIGGDLFVQAIVDYVTGERPTIKNDGMALQRIYLAAHAAVTEINTNSHADLNVPYIGMNMTTRQPEHLQERVPRKVIEQLVESAILKNMDESKLSSHMPPPTNLTFMWISILTQFLEITGLTPMQLSHILLVGGGSKHPLMESTVKECFVTLQGNIDNFIIPQERSELVAKGASSLLPNYGYDIEKGLVRQDESSA
jgi:actin-like ATPase involved in cell morphogenesis